MPGKVLKRANTMPILDKPIIKNDYYPPGKPRPNREATRVFLKPNIPLKNNNNKEIKVINNDEPRLSKINEEQASKNGDGSSVGSVNKSVDNTGPSDMTKVTGTKSGQLSLEPVQTKPKKHLMQPQVDAKTGERQGSYEYDNRFFKYEGQWKGGKKHGHGKLYFNDGSYYEGMFEHGEINGIGTKYFAKTGIKYQGQFDHGEMHGKGRMTWPDGSVYEGQWIKNRKEGFGIMKSVKENMIYKGTYINNKRQGRGTMIYPQGDRYDGDWSSDMRHGEGDMKFMDGTVYEGEFENDSFNGNGTMRHCSGLVYNGCWVNGNPTVLPVKLVITLPDGKEPHEVIQGQPFDIRVQCLDENGQTVEVDSCRELRITGGFKHIKAKKGTALFDLIEEYEEKPMETPYYEVLQYPLTDFIAEEEPTEELEKECTIVEDDVIPDGQQPESDLTEDSVSGMDDPQQASIAEEGDEQQEGDSQGPGEGADPAPEVGEADPPVGDETTPDGTSRRGSLVPPDGTTSETPMSMYSGAGSVMEGSLMDKEARPLPPPVSNKRSENGECEWKNITLAPAPPRFPPFVAMDEEEKKKQLRQQKQAEDGVENDSNPESTHDSETQLELGSDIELDSDAVSENDVEAKRMNRLSHDDRFARVGEYIIMVHDVTNPPFMGKNLEPAFTSIKIKRPKREKKAREVKPKWDTSKHIAQSMLRT